MLGNRNSQHSFAQIPAVNTTRSQFDRSFALKDTFNFDYLIPIMVDEILPGDTVNLNLNTFARLATQKVPIMDNMYIDFFFFYVPNRLLWNNWEKFNGAQDDPGDSIDYVLPTITAPAVTGFPVGSIYDKMGLPTGIPSLVVNNSLPLRVYNKIWNEWFRDQNLQDSIIKNVDDGPDAYADYVLKKRNKKHDYFTSALPWPQKGDDVLLPLGSTAPITSTEVAFELKKSGGSNRNLQVNNDASNTITLNGAGSYGTANLLFGQTTGLEADLSSATSATINELRQAFAVQSMLELDARGGTRYVEILQAHFNVVSPDFRLQRSELLSVSTTKINSHPVPQTSPTSGSNAQAQLAAFATQSTSGQSVGFSKSFVEHGYIIGLASARADLTYQQGINRMWNRTTRYDFYWPKLSELGEQSILNKEIYTQGTSADEEVFGYQERYAEYRYKPSEIHGEFRSTYTTPLDYWHLSEEFGSLPALNTTFIESTTPIERALAVTDGPDLLFDAYFNYKHARPMPVYSTPVTLGKF